MNLKFLGLFLALFHGSAFAEAGIVGQVETTAGCSAKNAMVWLSLDKENYKERLLLMHTAVPVRGKFQFYLKPGSYQLRASDEEGCEFLSKVSVSREIETVNVTLRKK